MGIKSTKTGVLIFLLTCLLFSSITAQSCKSYAVPSNQEFSSCNDLPFLKSSLYWNYDSSAGTASIAFRATGVSADSNWIAWGLNPSSSGMIGSQALVAHRNSSGALYAYTSSITSYSTTLPPSALTFPVLSLSAVAPSNNEMIIFATIIPGRSRMNQAWQVGPLSGGAPQAHSITGDNIKSAGTIDFLSPQTSLAGSAPLDSKQMKRNVHGVLNAVSWGTLMPVGGIIARYLRVFKSADPAWFYLHVTCQFCAYVIGVAGWATGLKLGSQSVGIVYSSHRNIGITLFCLATLQVFALLLRPKKENKYRYYWNIYHHSIGYTVIILSVINIYKGFDILDPEKKWKTTYTGILISLAVIAVALEAFTWLVALKRKADSQEKHGHGANNGPNNGSHNGYGSKTQPFV